MFFENRLFLYSFFSIFLIHGVLIAWAMLAPFANPLKIPKQKVFVRTVLLNNAPAPSSSSSSIAEVKKPQPSNLIPKKNANIKKPSTEMPKEKDKKIDEISKEKSAQLQRIRDNLKALQNQISGELGDVGVIASLKIDSAAGLGSEEAAYSELLSLQLKQFLKLREKGSVKIQLTLNREGKMVSLKSLSSDSERNKKAVETAIKNIRFPPFGNSFKGEDTHIFSLTLTNEA